MLGCEPVDGVAESGFHFQEHNGSEPFRWTNGAAKLLVPIDAAPSRMWVSVDAFRPKAISVRLHVLVDGATVFDGSVPPGKWERTFYLRSQQFSEELLIELRSNVFVPKGVIHGGKSTDKRVLGVQVKGIMLQDDDE
jgi:hypothetical protein